MGVSTKTRSGSTSCRTHRVCSSVSGRVVDALEQHHLDPQLTPPLHVGEVQQSLFHGFERDARTWPVDTAEELLRGSIERGEDDVGLSQCLADGRLGQQCAVGDDRDGNAGECSCSLDQLSQAKIESRFAVAHDRDVVGWRRHVAERILQLGEDILQLEVLLAVVREVVRSPEHAVDAAEVARLVGDGADAKAPAQAPGGDRAVDVAVGHGMSLLSDLVRAFTA